MATWEEIVKREESIIPEGLNFSGCKIIGNVVYTDMIDTFYSLDSIKMRDLVIKTNTKSSIYKDDINTHDAVGYTNTGRYSKSNLTISVQNYDGNYLPSGVNLWIGYGRANFTIDLNLATMICHECSTVYYFNKSMIS